MLKVFCFVLCLCRAKPHWSGMLKIRGLGWQANYDISVIEKKAVWLWVRFKNKYWTLARPCCSSVFKIWNEILRVEAPTSASLKKEEFCSQLWELCCGRHICVCVCERERRDFDCECDASLKAWKSSVCSFIEMVFHHVHALCTREYIDQTWRCKLGGVWDPNQRELTCHPLLDGCSRGMLIIIPYFVPQFFSHLSFFLSFFC